MKLQQYFEYKKDSLSVSQSEFLNILNKIEDNKTYQSKKLNFINFKVNLSGLKYFVSGVAVSSFVYFIISYNNIPSQQSLVISDADIKIEYLENAIQSIDITSDAFSNIK